MYRKDNPIGIPNIRNFKIEETSQIFNDIYDRAYWAHGDGSGGNSQPHIVADLFPILDEIFETYDITTVADLGCGSHYVFKDYKWPDHIQYTGYEASTLAIERANKNCNRDDFTFVECSDFNEIPPCDFIFAKDVTCHWHVDLVHEFVDNIIPKFKYGAIIGGRDINLTEKIKKECTRSWSMKTGKGKDYGVWFFSKL